MYFVFVIREDRGAREDNEDQKREEGEVGRSKKKKGTESESWKEGAKGWKKGETGGQAPREKEGEGKTR